MNSRTTVTRQNKNRYVIPQNRRLEAHDLEIKPTLKTSNRKKLQVKALIDSGCMTTCIGEELIKREKIPTARIPKPITCRNSDGTISRNKLVTDFVKLKMDIHAHKE